MCRQSLTATADGGSDTLFARIHRNTANPGLIWKRLILCDNFSLFLLQISKLPCKNLFFSCRIRNRSGNQENVVVKWVSGLNQFTAFLSCDCDGDGLRAGDTGAGVCRRLCQAAGRTSTEQVSRAPSSVKERMALPGASAVRFPRASTATTCGLLDVIVGGLPLETE